MVVKNAMNDADFRQSIQRHPPANKEIIYDYEPNAYAYQSLKLIMEPSSGMPVPVSRGQLGVRSKSLPFMGNFVESLATRVERVESTAMHIKRKIISNHDSETSIKFSRPNSEQ